MKTRRYLEANMMLFEDKDRDWRWWCELLRDWDFGLQCMGFVHLIFPLICAKQWPHSMFISGHPLFDFRLFIRRDICIWKRLNCWAVIFLPSWWFWRPSCRRRAQAGRFQTATSLSRTRRIQTTSARLAGCNKVIWRRGVTSCSHS